MKRFLGVLLSISVNAVGTYHLDRPTHNFGSKNMRLCLNSTADFGKRHFIVGYKEKKTPTIFDIVVSEAQQEKKSNRVAKKKQGAPFGGATLIDKNRLAQSFFTSIHNLSDILLRVISEAKKSLYIAAFTLTDIRIADRIIERHKNGVDVCVITDAGNMKHAYSKIQKLIDNNIPVWSYSPALNPTYKKSLYEPFMHHKCMCIDNELVVTGSANLTKAGQKDNIENIILLRDKQTVAEHCQEIERLKKYCVQCKPLTIK